MLGMLMHVYCPQQTCQRHTDSNNSGNSSSQQSNRHQAIAAMQPNASRVNFKFFAFSDFRCQIDNIFGVHAEYPN